MPYRLGTISGLIELWRGLTRYRAAPHVRNQVTLWGNGPRLTWLDPKWSRLATTVRSGSRVEGRDAPGGHWPKIIRARNVTDWNCTGFGCESLLSLWKTACACFIELIYGNAKWNYDIFQTIYINCFSICEHVYYLLIAGFSHTEWRLI